MGAIVREIPKGSGRWFVSVNHRNERKVKKAADRKEAEKIALEINKTIAAEKAGILREDFNLKVAKCRVVFGDYADEWLAGYCATNLKKATRAYYRDMLNRIPLSIRRRFMDDITRDDVRKIAVGLIDKGLSRSTAAGVLRTISAIFNSAIEDGVFQGANPALRPGRLLRVAEDSNKVDVLSKDEAERFLATARVHFPEYYPLFLAALRTGARRGELIALRWEDVDLSGGVLTIRATASHGEVNTPKNGKSRRVPMSPQLVEAMREYRRKVAEAALGAGRKVSPWVFPSPAGNLGDPSKLCRVFKEALKKAGLRSVPFHSLRHRCLSDLAGAGVPMQIVKEIAGHSSIAVTSQYYLHLKPEEHREAVAVLDSPAAIRRLEKNANETRMDLLYQPVDGSPVEAKLAEIIN